MPTAVGTNFFLLALHLCLCRTSTLVLARKVIRSRGDLECAGLAASRVVMHEIMGIQQASESDFPSPSYSNVLKRLRNREREISSCALVGQVLLIVRKPICLSFDWWSVFVGPLCE